MVKSAHDVGIEVGAYDLIGWTRDPGRGWYAEGGAGACWASGWRDWLGGQVSAHALAIRSISCTFALNHIPTSDVPTSL